MYQTGLAGYPILSAAQRDGNVTTRLPVDAYEIVQANREMDPNDGDLFLTRLTVELCNFGDQPAEIYFEGSSEALEWLDWRQGEPLILLPSEQRQIGWMRWSGSAREYQATRDQNLDVLTPRLDFLVRDLGENVTDHYQLIADVGFFEVDGGRLIVNAERAELWKPKFAYPMPPRAYPRMATMAGKV